jgi:hypothetical protein
MSIKVRLDPQMVASVYAGRPGCACGCRGSHSTRPISIKRVVSSINLLIAANQHDIDVSITPYAPYVAVETDTRLRIAYLRVPGE